MEFSLIELLSLIFVSIPFTVFCIFVLVKLCKAVIDEIKKDRDFKDKNIVLLCSVHDMLKHLTNNLSENNDYLVELISKNIDEE